MSPSNSDNDGVSVNPLTLPEVQRELLAGRSVPERWRQSVRDLSPLSGLSGLRTLNLNSTGVTDVSALSGLSGLQRLDLRGTGVTDVSALSGLSGLQRLDLSETGVTDVSALSGLSGLQTLNLSRTGVTDVSALSGLSGLQWLDLSRTGVTGVTDVSALSGLSGLQKLDLSSTGVTDVSALSGLSGLQALNLNGTGVTDVSALSGLSGLQTLNLSRTGVTDVSALSRLGGLRVLDLSRTGVMDVSALSGLGGLRVLDLSRTGVTDVSALSGLSGLQTLNLRGTVVTDVSALAHLTGLQIIGFESLKAVRQPPSAPTIVLRRVSEAVTRSGLRLMPDRFKIRVEDPQEIGRLRKAQDGAVVILGASERYGFVSVGQPRGISEDRFHTAMERLCTRFGGRLAPDARFAFDHSDVDFDAALHADGAEAVGWLSGWEEVLTRIGARNLSGRYDGEVADVVIAVVDSGVDGTRREFAQRGKRLAGWAPPGENPWGAAAWHGTMCALIAAGFDAGPGSWEGVAPRAKIMPCRTSLTDAELVQIYERLGEMARGGTRVIATNSFSFLTGEAPEIPPELEMDFEQALADAIADGVIMVFSAGNNHGLAGGKPNACSPNSIWRFKGRDDLLTVGACDLAGGILPNSSRGLGQFHGEAGTNAKPDVVAPTAHAKWGTSAAAPQVAGLLALLWQQNPNLSRDELFDIVRSSAQDLDLAHACQGHGKIDCRAARNLMAVPLPGGGLAVGNAS